jgi:hypothetical protein
MIFFEKFLEKNIFEKWTQSNNIPAAVVGDNIPVAVVDNFPPVVVVAAEVVDNIPVVEELRLVPVGHLVYNCCTSSGLWRMSKKITPPNNCMFCSDTGRYNINDIISYHYITFSMI